MGDTGLETIGGSQVGREALCLLSFDTLRLAGVRSEWNLEWNLGRSAWTKLCPRTTDTQSMLATWLAHQRLGQLS